MIPALFRQRKDLALQLFSRDNITKLFQSHYTELNYSFTRSLDPRLYGKDAAELNDGSHYLLHVEKAEEVHLEELTYGEVFSFDGNTMHSNVLSAERFDDGSIDIFLPKNGIYAYRCTSPSITLSGIDSHGDATPLEENMSQEGRIGDRIVTEHHS